MALSDLPDVLGLEDREVQGSGRQSSGETSNMNGVGELPASLPQRSQDIPNMMTQSMVVPGTSMSAAPDLMTTSTSSLLGSRQGSGHRNQTSQNWFTFSEADNPEGRVETSAREKEREDRVRLMRETQEDDRRKKLEELKLHAQNAQKFREQQETERRRHIEQLRSKDMDRRMQVLERRNELDRSEQERRETILAKNKEREGRIEQQRRNSKGHIEFAFGSSAPRLIEPRVDSASGYWGSRSSNLGGLDRRSQEREMVDGGLRSKRTSSAQGLDRSVEGDDSPLVSNFCTSAHR